MTGCDRYLRSEITRPGEGLDVPRRERLRSSFRFRLAEFEWMAGDMHQSREYWNSRKT